MDDMVSAPRARFTPETRQCQNGPHKFTATRDHMVFCSTECRKAFDSRMLSRGRPAAPLLMAWTATRHAKPGTDEAEVCRYALSQLTAMASGFNELDEAEGRSAVAYVQTLIRSGTLYVDRAKRC